MFEGIGILNEFEVKLHIVGNVPPVAQRHRRIKPAICRYCVLALVDSGTVPAFTCDCLRVSGVFMRRRYFDLCVSTSSRTMLAFGNNVSCSSRTCSTLASNLR